MSVGGISSPATEINGVPVVQQGENSQMSKMQFLELLTVQLKYQDPMNPLDNTQMVEQQAMFAELEQMMNLNESFQSYVESQEGLMAQMATMFSTQQTVAFLGNTIDYPTDKIYVAEGEPTDIYYSLTEDSMVGYSIRNEAGNTVRTVDPTLVQEGKGLSLNIDGKDDFGQSLLDGTYTVDFNVTDLQGQQLVGTGYGRDAIVAIDFRQGTPILKTEHGELVDPGMVMSVDKGGE
ncbi:flagellar hook assembly protein FlgD [Candidatus Omnitrophota bacterium]